MSETGGVKRKAEDAPEGKAHVPKKAFVIQEDLVDLATQFVKSAGVISDAEAHRLWEAALDGPGVTQNEFATLDHILATYKFTDKARRYLTKLVTHTKSGKSQYKKINKIRYDRSCLDLADHLSKDGKLDLADAKLLWEEVEDGPGVTECEKRSIEYVMANNTLTDGAKTYLNDKLTSWKPPVRATVKAKPRNRSQKKFTLQIDLVQLAEEFKKSAGVISDAEAHTLWESALDGPGVTHNEFATLEFILSNYKFTDKARKYLGELVDQKSSGTSFYKKIQGVRYDRSCLDLADHLTKDGKIDLADAKQLWEDVEDGNKVTVVEKRTIEYVMGKYTLTDGAKKYFDEKLSAWKGPPRTEEKKDGYAAEEKDAAAAPASAASPADVDVIDLVWAAYDTDKSGDLDKFEAKNFVQHLLVQLGQVAVFTDETFDALFEAIDTDKNGTLDKAEVSNFIKNLMPAALSM